VKLKNSKVTAMRKTLICIDRDGTLIHDEKYHLFLGKDNDWPSKVRILPGVIEGLKKLRTIPDSSIYMITNQPGVAILDYPLLTLERAHEVCRYVSNEIKEMGAVIDGYFLCPHATPEYVSKKPGVNFEAKLVHDCKCLKPALGMVFDALKSENITVDNANIYVIGDRASDALTALNINGFGILIPFENQPGEQEKVRRFSDQTHILVVANMIEAAGFIADREARDGRFKA
jgi:histidinol-phosphate phosphatase family protein